MKTAQTTLEILFPKVRAELLHLFFSTPHKQRYTREVRIMTGLALSTVQDELRKLTAVGLLTTWSNGYHRFYRADPRHPMFGELFRIVQISTRLPRFKRSALRSSHPTRKKGTRDARTLPPARPTNWHLFSRSQKNSTV